MKIIRWKTITLLVAFMIAGISGVAVVKHIGVEAQDTQSILGGSPLYSLSGADGWINSKPLTAKELAEFHETPGFGKRCRASRFYARNGTH